MFEQMSNFVGCVLSAERLFEIRKTDNNSTVTIDDRKNTISISDLERRIKHYNMDLVVIENKLKQRVYVSRE